MSEWIRVIFDIALMGAIGVGIYHAIRLIRHLQTLHQGRVEMERFVREFSATVTRAETGIKGLKQTARESGDDLEKLVEKAVKVRDELHFLVESGDKIAERISQSASAVVKLAAKPDDPEPVARVTPPPLDKAAPSSRAEKELMQALQNMS